MLKHGNLNMELNYSCFSFESKHNYNCEKAPSE